MSTPSPEIPKATRHEWLGLAVLALPCLLYSMDLTVLNLAVPKLSAALRPTGTELLWMVDIYGFVLAGALIPMGGTRRSDRSAPSIADWCGCVRLRIRPGCIRPER